MKVIAVDNFDREQHDDALVCENVSEIRGKWIVDLLNERAPDRFQIYYRLVPDDHKLYKYDPNGDGG